jgi:hypothetical protein
MGLRKQQSDFMNALGKLIVRAYSLGYELTPGDTYPGKFKHKQGSFHELGLAIDLNLFIDGHFQTSTEAHRPLGEYWESIGGTWGGHWNDGNHYSWGET